MAVTDPVGIFGATVEAVYRLAPEAERLTTATSGTSRLSTPITDDTITAWIGEVSAAVSASIYRWREIDPTSHAHAAVVDAARAVVVNGAASYLEAARYPTRAGLDDSTYAGVLWNRYKQGIADLVSLVAVVIAADEDLVEEVGSSPQSRKFGSFPPTYFHDNPSTATEVPAQPIPGTYLQPSGIPGLLDPVTSGGGAERGDTDW